MLNRQKRIYSSQEALTWMVDVAGGMQYLHSVAEGKPMIIHRDLKLENIMLSPEPTGGWLCAGGGCAGVRCLYPDRGFGQTGVA
jgi:serine/threonine protein kinase